MLIIEIECLYNGVHRNQANSGVIPVPDGWAILPNSMETPNFRFGSFSRFTDATLFGYISTNKKTCY